MSQSASSIDALALELAGRWIQFCASRGVFPRIITDHERNLVRTHTAALVAELRRHRASTVEGDASVSLSPSGRAIVGTIMHLDQQMDTYENSDALDEAMSHIPLQDLHATADARQAGPDPLSCFEDALADALVKWFKPKFFNWADPITCPTCSTPMAERGRAQPTSVEREGGASVVEVYACENGDGNSFRFPRYNNLRALMKSRIGRCGEFANLFTLMLRAVGLRARYVWNAEDHVWNEYYSPGMQRWVHLDSCECARDESLLYDRGWGKKMSYVLAFSTEGAADVSRAYIQDWEAALQRRQGISETQLKQALDAVTTRRRFGLPPDELKRLEAEDAAQARWMVIAVSQSGDRQLEGRQSGTQEWIEQRGEGGETNNPN